MSDDTSSQKSRSGFSSLWWALVHFSLTHGNVRYNSTFNFSINFANEKRKMNNEIMKKWRRYFPLSLNCCCYHWHHISETSEDRKMECRIVLDFRVSMKNEKWIFIFHFPFSMENGKWTPIFSFFIENEKWLFIFHFSLSVENGKWK